mgnify:CR=1 FL=1
MDAQLVRLLNKTRRLWVQPPTFRHVYDSESVLIPSLGGGQVDRHPSFSIFLFTIFSLFHYFMLTLKTISDNSSLVFLKMESPIKDTYEDLNVFVVFNKLLLIYLFK